MHHCGCRPRTQELHSRLRTRISKQNICSSDLGKTHENEIPSTRFRRRRSHLGYQKSDERRLRINRRW
ncbi:hypothetical protein C8Q70DRAFT_997729 [Cubamyces menziesii]|nr:hypothetical protein C8Q70DRAFT_997729 [Cubamyces menziesii]